MANEYEAEAKAWEVSSRTEADSYTTAGSFNDSDSLPGLTVNDGLSGAQVGLLPETYSSKINTDTSEGQFDQEMGHVTVSSDPASLSSLHSSLSSLAPEIANQLVARPPDENVEESTNGAVEAALQKLFGDSSGGKNGSEEDSFGGENQAPSNNSLSAQQMRAFGNEPPATTAGKDESIEYHLIL